MVGLRSSSWFAAAGVAPLRRIHPTCAVQLLIGRATHVLPPEYIRKHMIATTRTTSMRRNWKMFRCLSPNLHLEKLYRGLAFGPHVGALFGDKLDVFTVRH
jgi:hypothetical protein